MTGSKYKVAHKRVNKEVWSIDDFKQRKEIIKILKDMIAELETAPEPESAEQNRKTGKKVDKTKQTQLLLINP